MSSNHVSSKIAVNTRTNYKSLFHFLFLHGPRQFLLGVPQKWQVHFCPNHRLVTVCHLTHNMHQGAGWPPGTRFSLGPSSRKNHVFQGQSLSLTQQAAGLGELTVKIWINQKALLLLLLHLFRNRHCLNLEIKLLRQLSLLFYLQKRSALLL